MEEDEIPLIPDCCGEEEIEEAVEKSKKISKEK